MTDEKSTTTVWWIEPIKSLGVPTVFLCVVVIMLWRAGAYISAEVVMPLFQRQMTFIDTATKTLSDTQIASAAVQHGQSKGFEGLETIDETTTQTAIDVKRILELLKEIEFVVKSQGKAAE